METDIRKIISNSTLTEESQLQVVEIYNRMKKSINEIEDSEVKEIVKEENLLGAIDDFIKSIADNTFEQLLITQLFPKKIENPENIITLSIRISRYEGWLTLYRFESDQTQEEIGDVTIDCMVRITCSKILEDGRDEANLIEDLLPSIEDILEICLKEQISLEKLPEWNLKHKIPIYYCSDYEECENGASDGILLATMK